MAEVEAKDIDPGPQQTSDHVLALAARTDGCDDFGPSERALMVRPLLGHGTEPSFLQWLPVLGAHVITLCGDV